MSNKKGDVTCSDSDEKSPKDDANTEELDIVETNVSETISNKAKSRHQAIQKISPR
jgi:hypothetical protein